MIFVIRSIEGHFITLQTGCLLLKVVFYISQVYYIVSPNYTIFYAGESFNLRSILGDVMG
jgi:hypothetical protein